MRAPVSGVSWHRQYSIVQSLRACRCKVLRECLCLEVSRRQSWARGRPCRAGGPCEGIKQRLCRAGAQGRLVLRPVTRYQEHSLLWFARPACRLELPLPLPPLAQGETGTVSCCMIRGSAGFSVDCNSLS